MTGIGDESPGTGPLEQAARVCVATLKETMVQDGIHVGWGTWELDENADPLFLHAGRSSLYDGNAGIAWALRLLGSDMGDVQGSSGPSGLLGGTTGWALAAGVPPPLDLTDRGFDLGDGLAGDVLAHVRTHSPDGDAVDRLVRALAGGAIREGGFACWADPRRPGDRPLCGMAHGASGVALALAEAAVAFPSVAPVASPLVAAALRWESAWFDPVRGWPDLRSGSSYPVLWCHGAGGIAAARLRLLQLVEGGLVLDYRTEAIAAEAQAGVLACGRELTRAAASARRAGLDAVPYGLTLCHGMGGLLDVLVLASEVWNEPAHLSAARRIAVDLLATAPEDPMEWPGGLKAPGSLGLFVGVAGVALMLARLADPARIGSLSLLAP